MLARLLLVVWLALGMPFEATAQPRILILSTTTSTQDSGLLHVLVPTFEGKTGSPVEEGTDPPDYIAVTPVNPARFAEVDADGARRLADWLVSDEDQQPVAASGVDRYGEPLFCSSADTWRKKPPTG